jgi:NCS1 family nucleobase:cation symporter-1
LLPGLANKIAPDTVIIGQGMENLFAINWLYGFIASIVLYVGMNIAAPHRRTLIPAVIHGTASVYEGSEPDTEGSEHHVIDSEKGGPSMEASGAAKIGLVAMP